MSVSAPLLHFEDFRPGEVAHYGAYPVSREAILAFAAEFDPQPFHLDEQAAEASLLGGLAASGWHTCAMVMRINCDGFLLQAAALGAPGIEQVKWLKPVRPGDVLGVCRTVLDARPSRSRPFMGLVDFRFDVLNQLGDVVMEQKNVVMFRRVGADPEETGATARPPVAASGAGQPADEPPILPFFEDVEVGATLCFGSRTFERDAMLRFARAFDPQPFHLDEEAARRSPFGALAASGWQTAALWMRAQLDFHARREAETAARGLPVPRNGPSPGFRDLKWLRPVYVGDTITYSTTVTDKRVSASRPGWGLLFHKNTGVDAAGKPVFEFSGASFLERRGGG